MESLEATVREIGERRHVCAGELVGGLCRHAKQRYGMLAYDVLKQWGVATGSDVGEIVFQLIDVGILSRREEDTRADFDGMDDFKRVLEDDYFGAGNAV
jgi:uncharacterized repeat protein (TIGR04138 family)